MLQQAGRYNDLSPKLIEKINNKLDSLGRKVRYKFNISNEDPHPDNKGQRIFPFLWTLDPVTFNIIDNDEDRKDKQKLKRIGIVESLKENGEPDRFRRIRISERDKGVLVLDMGKTEDREDAFYLELHPKLSGGSFVDKNVMSRIERIDEGALATEQRKIRKDKIKASDVAVNMSDKEIVEFADAMSGGNNVEWDSTQDIGVLRNKVEELAENSPVYFNDLVESKNIEYQAIIKQAMNKGIISFDPADYSFKWTTNNQPIAVLQPAGEKNEVQKLAELFQAGGTKQEALYEKIKNIVTGKDKEVIV